MPLFRHPHSLFPIPLIFLLLLAACSFDYGTQEADSGLPDIVMDSVEYVRVRSADPQARLLAERVERYETRRLMELRNFSFEQFGNGGEDVNANGRAGTASFEIDSGDIRMGGGVRLEVESEDIVIETDWLEWRDKPRTLSGREGEEVFIYRENGTIFTGIGFQSNARLRTWEFSGGAEGSYIHDDDDEEELAEEEAVAETEEENHGGEQA